jgi:hypothetical protein
MEIDMDTAVKDKNWRAIANYACQGGRFGGQAARDIEISIKAYVKDLEYQHFSTKQLSNELLHWLRM